MEMEEVYSLKMMQKHHQQFASRVSRATVLVLAQQFLVPTTTLWVKIVGGIRNQAFHAPKTKECFSRPDFCTKDPEAKSLKPLNLSSSFRSRFSA
jgi:hypothetical protein